MGRYEENVEAEKELDWDSGPGPGSTLTGYVLLSKLLIFSAFLHLVVEVGLDR